MLLSRLRCKKRSGGDTLCFQAPILQGADILSLQAFVARRVITPDGIPPAAILVKGEQIEAVGSPDQVPGEGDKIHDFGGTAILPGPGGSPGQSLDPGRRAWD